MTTSPYHQTQLKPHLKEAERGTDSILDEADTYAADAAGTDNSDDNQIIDVIATSSDQEGTIIVDPTTLEEDVQTPAREVGGPAVADPPTMGEDVQTLAREADESVPAKSPTKTTITK
jgi:hypothetical protein